MGDGWNYPGATWPALTGEQVAMVEANLGLVAWVLNRRRTDHDEWDDAWQNGVLGLVRAVQLYDPAKGFRFSVYARDWIRNTVIRGWALETGAHARRALRSGHDDPAPVSLDAAFDDRTLADQLPAGNDPDTDAVHLLASVEAVCDDDFDRAILRAVADGLPLAHAASECGRPESLARYRLQRMRRRLGVAA